MKKSSILILILVSSLGFSQKLKSKIKPRENPPQTSNALLVTPDAKAIAEAKAKAAAEEKAKLPKPYHPEENAEEKLKELLLIAQKENKNIMIQAGGNWCIWCLRFDNFVNNTPELKKIIDENFIYYHLNYSQENKNEKIFSSYGNPGEKFGYPVFIILNKDGKQIHTQDSAVLESGSVYSLEKVKEFFTTWKPGN